MESGDIPGAYWAVMTHPLTNEAMVREAFGDVHMLSHLVGSASRIDISRLSRLEAELTERDETIARLRALSMELAARARRIESLEADLNTAVARLESRPAIQPVANDLSGRLALAEERLGRSADELAEQRERADLAEKRAGVLEARERDWENERAALQALLAAPASDGDAASSDLRGATLLYVGGRPGQVDQLRALTGRLGGILLSHDGGIEDSAALLPGLVSRADVVLFPVDCISHHAAGQVKKLCSDMGKSFVPLRSASVASYAAAVAELRERGTIGAAVAIA